MKGIPIVLLLVLLPAQGVSQIPRVWTQTSTTDFQGNTLSNVIVTNRNGGELRLDHPLLKSRVDTLDNSYSRFVALDSGGNFIRSWYVADSILAQRFDSAGNATSSVLRVSDPGKGISLNNRRVDVALMNNGYFYATWTSRDSAKVYGQLFAPANQRLGPHVRFDPYTTQFNGDPTVFPNPYDSTFWVLLCHRFPTRDNPCAILYWRINLSGQIIQGPRMLHSQMRHETETESMGRMSPNGEFLVTWIGMSGDVGTIRDTIFVQKFDYSGLPLTAMRIVNENPGGGCLQPKIAIDQTGRYVLVWGDNRNNPGSVTYEVFGQLFDFDDRPIEGNFLVNDRIGPAAVQALQHEIRFERNRYSVCWGIYNSATGQRDTYYNKWSYNFDLAGTVISSVHDAGPIIRRYQTIEWQGSYPPGTTNVFQLRSAASLAQIDTSTWYGPTGPGDYYTISGSTINLRHDRQRYLQYRGILSTDRWGITPELQSMSIRYQIDSAVAPQPPSNLAASTSTSLVRLAWQASPSPRLLYYRIHRGIQTGMYDSLWTRTVSPVTLTFRDSTVRNGRTYFYAVSVVDSNFVASPFSNEVSATPLGTKIYVQAGVSPGGNGTPMNPYATISQGLFAATWGDTVVVLPGVYAELVRMKQGVSLIGSGPRLTRIQSSLAGDTTTVVIGADSSRLSGFTIAYSRVGTSSEGAIAAYGTNPVITDNVLLDEIHLPYTYGLYASGANVVFCRNYVVGFDWGFLSSQSPSPVVENNVIVANIGIMIVGPTTLGGRIINNTILSSENGLNLSLNLFINSNVRNNIAVGRQPDPYSVGLRVDAGSLTADFNDVWGFVTNYGSRTSGVGNISVDPLFVGESRADYRLCSNSPCRNGGDPNPIYNDPDGSRNDMGAFGGPSPIDPTIFAGIPVTFATGSATGFPGDTVTVGVSLSDAARFSRGEFTVSYMSSFARLLSVSRTPLTQNFQLAVDSSSVGSVRVSLLSPGEIGSGSGDLVQISFRIALNALPGQASPLGSSGVTLRDSLNELILIQEVRNGTIVLNPGSGPGRYIYVDQRNPGPGNGTRYDPFKTIQAGVNGARRGDTVVVASGAYCGFVAMRDSIHLRGSGPAITSIEGDSTVPPSFDATVKFYRVREAHISGFAILSPPSPFGLNITCDSSDVEIFQNRIVNNRSSIQTVQIIHGSNVSLHDSYVYADVYASEALIQVDRSVIRASRNTFGNQIEQNLIILRNGTRARVGNNLFSFGGYSARGVDIAGCRQAAVHNNLFVRGTSQATAVFVRQSDSVSVLNNTIDTRYRALDVDGPSAAVLNNIVVGNSSFGVSAGTGTYLGYNDVWGNATNYWNTQPGFGDISEDPRFVNEAQADYRLLPDSPCRDAGHPDPSYNDLDGSRNDMGLYGGPLLDTLMFPLHGSSIQAPGLSVELGDTFSVPIIGTCLNDVAGVTAVITFDPSLLCFQGALTSSASAGMSLSSSSMGSGILGCSLSGTYGVCSDSTVIFSLLFSARNAIGSSPINFQQISCLSSTMAAIPLQRIVNGRVSIGPTDVSDGNGHPSAISLFQNYPNPFNPSTTIRYELPRSSLVTLRVFNILGQEIATLVDGQKQAGCYEIKWNAGSFPSGVYFYRLQAGDFVQTKKLVILK